MTNDQKNISEIKTPSRRLGVNNDMGNFYLYGFCGFSVC